MFESIHFTITDTLNISICFLVILVLCTEALLDYTSSNHPSQGKENNFHLTLCLCKLLTLARLDRMLDLFLAKQIVWGSPYRLHRPRRKNRECRREEKPSWNRYQVMMFAVLTWVSFSCCFFSSLGGDRAGGLHLLCCDLWLSSKTKQGRCGGGGVDFSGALSYLYFILNCLLGHSIICFCFCHSELSF